jgi:hypothetical protein
MAGHSIANARVDEGKHINLGEDAGTCKMEADDPHIVMSDGHYPFCARHSIFIDPLGLLDISWASWMFPVLVLGHLAPSPLDSPEAPSWAARWAH